MRSLFAVYILWRLIISLLGQSGSFVRANLVYAIGPYKGLHGAS